jgi:uncharacterized phage protein gp47/JayE
MPQRTYTEDELREIANAQIRGNVSGADVSPYSDYDQWSRVLAAIAAGSQAHASALVRQRFPKDCDDAEVPLHGESRGLSYLAPTKARGYLIVEGAAGDVVPTGSEFGDGTYIALADATCSSGAFTPITVAEGSTRERLIVSSSTGVLSGTLISVGTQTSVVSTIVAPGIIDLLIPLSVIPFVGDLISGVAGALVLVEATETGSRYNAPPLTELAFDSVPLGTALASVALVARLAGGGDAETASEYRARVVDYEAGRAASSNVEAVRTLAKAYPDARIAEAYVYPNLGYPGHMAVVAVGVAGARELSVYTAAALETYLVSALGSELDLTVYVVDYDGTAADIDLTLLAGTGFEPDWGTSTTNALTVGVGSTLARVELTTSPVGIIPVGARVLVPMNLGAAFRTEQRQVRGVDATGLDLDADLSAEPTGGGTITSGSPVAQSIIDSISRMFDALGPGTYVASATKDRIRWPNPATTGGAIVSETRVRSAAEVDGVLSIDFTSGSFATLTPAALETIRLGILTLRYEYV